MEKSVRGDRVSLVRLVLPIIVGAAVFVGCILLFPVLLLKTEDPASYVSIACAATVALTAFFASLVAAKGSALPFAATGLICTFVIAALLFVPAFLSDNGESLGFTTLLALMALVFSMLGARFGKGTGKARDKKRQRKRR